MRRSPRPARGPPAVRLTVTDWELFSDTTTVELTVTP
jgi:hypothetical protein